MLKISAITYLPLYTNVYAGALYIHLFAGGGQLSEQLACNVRMFKTFTILILSKVSEIFRLLFNPPSY